MAKLLNCYNRGCGQSFDPENNNDDVCCHHPGLPFFHDAYKGWNCCNKRTVDFTEFLNIKGCKLSKHSNEKPPELPKPIVDKENAHVKVEVNISKPVFEKPIERPPYDSPLTQLKPVIAESLKNKINDCPHNIIHKIKNIDSNIILVGTKCKNGGCQGEYQDSQSNEEGCVYHSGVPIFHEGLKYWSCCQKKTTDFNTFLNQIGCNKGLHKWKKEVESINEIKCRWDWHEAGKFVVVAVYAKEYNPIKSWIKINPIRLCVQLVFPKENDALFNLDLELFGVIDVKESSAQMYGTKVEIKLHKTDIKLWSKFNIPRPVTNKGDEKKQFIPLVDIDDVDLTDVEPISQIGHVTITDMMD